MVSGHRKSVCSQALTDLLYLLSCKAVNNAAVSWMGFQIIADRSIPILRSRHTEIKIFPIKPCCHHHWLLQLQNINHIVPYILCSCCRKSSNHWSFGKAVYKIHNLQIAGPEILPPLRNAVSLIYCHHRNFCMKGKIQKAIRQKPFRRHINDRITPHSGKFQSLIILPRCERAV